MSGSLGGDLRSDIRIELKDKHLLVESKYLANGNGFSFLTKTHIKQPADVYVYKQKTGPNFIVLEHESEVCKLFLKWLSDQ